jgi:DNA polymerase sigma
MILGVEILKYGSSINGLCTSSSDLDLTLICRNKSAFNALNEAKTKLKNKNFMVEEDMPRKDRAGWILKVQDLNNGMRVDMMVNKISQVLNSHLLL